VQLVVAAPPVIEAERGKPFALGVKATDLEGRHVALSASGLPAGASFADQGDDTGVLQWTPGWDQFGDYVVTFLGDNGAGGHAVGRSRIDVIGQTSLQLVSEEGDSVGRGEHAKYGRDQALFYSLRDQTNHSVV